jgi:hypothetical protein
LTTKRGVAQKRATPLAMRKKKLDIGSYSVARTGGRDMGETKENEGRRAVGKEAMG